MGKVLPIWKKHIPSNSSQVYREQWKGEPDWLGYEAETIWLPNRVKELLKGLIESREIYEWDEAVLYSFLLRKGLLNLDNRHKQFFRNLIEASRTNDGKEAIEEYANSDSETPPDLSKITPMVISNDSEQEIQSAFSNELTPLVKQHGDPLDYGDIKTAEQILANTNVLESINIDEEAIQFYLDYSIDELWKSAFRNKESTIAGVKKKARTVTSTMIQ
jgi:hypothetical protein